METSEIFEIFEQFELKKKHFKGEEKDQTFSGHKELGVLEDVKQKAINLIIAELKAGLPGASTEKINNAKMVVLKKLVHSLETVTYK